MAYSLFKFILKHHSSLIVSGLLITALIFLPLDSLILNTSDFIKQMFEKLEHTLKARWARITQASLRLKV